MFPFYISLSFVIGMEDNFIPILAVFGILFVGCMLYLAYVFTQMEIYLTLGILLWSVAILFLGFIGYVSLKEEIQ
jgi:hypothetical protein